jgi:uncharacterized protein YjiK
MIKINPEFLKKIREVQKPEFQMNLAERDKILTQIEAQIEAKRNLLIKKRSYLEQTAKENAFLEGVKNDYQKYRDYIVKEKEDQIRAMNILKQYTDDLVVSSKLTEADIKKTKRDQHDILREMDKIKRELNEIIGASS